LLAPEAVLRTALDRLRSYGNRLLELRQHGLSLQTAVLLHKGWANGSMVHHLRAHCVDRSFVEAWDAEVTRFWELALQRDLDPLQRAQLHLPPSLGGCGVTSLAQAREAAFLGSWEQCLAAVGEVSGSASAHQFRQGVRGIVTQIEAAALQYRQRGGSCSTYAFDWQSVFVEPRRRRQRALTAKVQFDAYRSLLDSLLSSGDSAGLTVVRSAGGPGAGGFLEPPDEPELVMPDARFATCLRARLRCPHPAACSLSAAATHCQHRFASTGDLCGVQLDKDGQHAGSCDVGGGVEWGHNSVVNWLAGWIEEETGEQCPTEQFVPAWNRAVAPRADARCPCHGGTEACQPAGHVELARLDAHFVDHAGTDTYVDVAIPSPHTTGVDERRRRAQEDGRAAQLTCDTKHARYRADRKPESSLVAFVVEAYGRPSAEAAGLLRAMAAGPQAVRAVTLGRAWRHLSVRVQTRLAELLLSAELPRAPR
jgi:hypothetical protein